jgi:hypothetical protein
MTLAGGALSLAACSGGNLSPGGQDGSFIGGGCGNANPDPCICGRPDASVDAAAACDAELACQAAGGTFKPFSTYDSATGTTTPAHCELDGGEPHDAATPDAGSDGV